MTKLSYWVGGVVIVLLILSVMWWKESQTPEIKPYSGPSSQLTLAIGKVAVSAPVFVAMEQGFFSDQGLEVELQMHASGKKAVDAMLDGEADVVSTGETPVALGALRGQDLKVLTETSTSSTELALVAHREAGIETLEDLRGKTIGVTKGTTGEFFLDSLLLVASLTQEDVTVVDVPSKERYEALISGRVQAQVALNPDVARMQRFLDEGGVSFTGDGIYRQVQSMVTRSDVIAAQASELERMVWALQAAQHFISENPDQAQVIVARSIDLSPELVASIWDNYAFEVGLSQEIVLTLEQEAKWAIKNELVTGSLPNYLDFMYTDALEAVNPRAVTIIR